MGDVFSSVASGDISIITSAIYILIALIVSAIGGSIGGILVGGKHMGNELAAMMGSFYGPIGAVPGILLALVVLVFI